MSLLTAQDWSFPVPIRYGPHRIREIAEICQQQNMSCPLIVMDQGSAASTNPRSATTEDIVSIIREAFDYGR